jgi:hypothetical protein
MLPAPEIIPGGREGFHREPGGPEQALQTAPDLLVIIYHAYQGIRMRRRGRGIGF